MSFLGLKKKKNLGFLKPTSTALADELHCTISLGFCSVKKFIIQVIRERERERDRQTDRQTDRANTGQVVGESN